MQVNMPDFLKLDHEINELNGLLGRPIIEASTLAVAAGCHFSDAVRLLLHLVAIGAAEMGTHVFHMAHPETPPALTTTDTYEFPLFCDICEEEFEASEAWCQPFFLLKETIELVVNGK
jgi:hypothetical protein